MMSDAVKFLTKQWSSLRMGYSFVSQRVLPPWDLLAEYVVSEGKPPVSHRTLCIVAMFGECMVKVENAWHLEVTWEAQPMEFRSDRRAQREIERSVVFQLWKQIDKDTVMKMRRYINETRDGSVPKIIPQFQLMDELLRIEYKQAFPDGIVRPLLLAVADTATAVNHFRLCPVER